MIVLVLSRESIIMKEWSDQYENSENSKFIKYLNVVVSQKEMRSLFKEINQKSYTHCDLQKMLDHRHKTQKSNTQSIEISSL
jgi:hypothetical protein